MRVTDEEWELAVARVIALFREVGTLLLAFAPLDYAMQPGVSDPRILQAFLLAGLALFALSLIAEWRSRP